MNRYFFKEEVAVVSVITVVSMAGLLRLFAPAGVAPKDRRDVPTGIFTR